MTIAGRLMGAACIAATLVACGSGQRAEGERRPRWARTLSGSLPQSPGIWVYHPARAAELHFRLALPGGGVLFAGGRGERWLVDSSGHATPAARLAPETLIFASPSGEGWAFVGESGTRYEADSPLGAFIRSSAPEPELASVVAEGSVLLGISREGRLYRRDAESGWRPAGPEAPRFVDVALLAGGRGLALAIPEALWETSDGGATWRSREEPTQGVLGLVRDRELGLAVDTVLGSRAWKPNAVTQFEPIRRAVARPDHRLGGALALGPSAAAMVERRAIVLGDRYYELRPVERGMGYEWIFGKLLGPLGRRPVPAFDGCRSLRFSAHGSSFVAACARGRDAAAQQPLDVLRSEDGGAHWDRAENAVVASIPRLELSVGAGGTTIVSGACAGREVGACSPTGIHRLLRVARGYELERLAAPDLEGTVDALAFGLDGVRAFAIGKRAKTRRRALFVYTPGQEAFAAQDLAAASGHRVNEDGDEAHSAIVGGMAEDGSIAFVLTSASGQSLVVVDAEGQLLAESSPPHPGAALGAAGLRGVALVPGTQEAWETLDAGATWTSIGRPPLDLCGTGRRCDVPVACHSAGCFVGHQVSRIGWQGQEDFGAPAGAAAIPELALARTERVRTPLACILDVASWVPLPPGTVPPTADQAALGSADWFAAVEDAETASVRVLEADADLPGPPRVTLLLEPVHRPERYAVAISTQVEGVVALRYPLPAPHGAGAGRITAVDVAWRDIRAGGRGLGRIADVGPYQPGDFEAAPGPAERARPALMSIAAGGVYVRPHAAAGDRQAGYFMDGRSVTVIPPVAWPAPLLTHGRTEMVHVGASHVPVHLSDLAVVRSTSEGAAPSFDAVTVGFRRPGDFDLTQRTEIAYVGDRAALHVTLEDDARDRTLGTLRPFQAAGTVLGAPLAVPTQRSLAEQPARCTDAQRSGTPRVVVPHHAGTRHPVLVQDAVEPLRVLITDRAVVRGTPDAPCAVAFDAELVAPDPAAPEARFFAVILLESLDRAWLFRSTRAHGKDAARTDVRRMSCRFDAAVEVPREVYRAKGTAVR